MAAVPTFAAAFVLTVFVFGSQSSEKQLRNFEKHVDESMAYQQSVLQLPGFLHEIQRDLYLLAILHQSNAPAREIQKIEDEIVDLLDTFHALKTGLDPRVTTSNLYDAMSAVRLGIEEVQTTVRLSEADGAAAVQNVNSRFIAAMAVIDNMIAQSSQLLLSDLQDIRSTTQSAAHVFFIGFSIIGLALAAIAFIASRSISAPILSLADTVAALDNGDTDAHVPATGRNDEIGEVARAINLFKKSLIRNKQLLAERDDLNFNLERKVKERTSELAIQQEMLRQSKKRAEAQREEMTSRLLTAFGDVIRAAQAGDFSQRVSTQFADENLQSIADDINSLVTQVDRSVAAISGSMHDLVEGTLEPESHSDFSGAFADIMAQIRETAGQIATQSSQLEHIARHDALTGLPNRRFLDDRLEDYNQLRKDEEVLLAVMHIDLDHFKEINDTLGHASGDRVLQSAARSLEDLSGNDDFVARAGGDEFIMLCPMRDANDRSRIIELGNKIVATLTAPIAIDGNEARFGASIGVAFNDAKTSDFSSLIVDADIALYRAKEDGRNRVSVFSGKMASALVEKRALRDELLGAIERDEFVPFFQPKFDAVSHTIVGVEALARWQHPSRGNLLPDLFLAAADEMKIVPLIDERIFQKSVDILTGLWKNDNIQIPELSVNVSQDRLFNPELKSVITGLDVPFQVSFELLEAIYFDDQGDQFYWMLDDLREQNIAIHIDDFGSGRASISALISTKPERLKIDKSLVLPVTKEGGSHQLIKGIVEIARSMNIGVTAEGVETRQHADILRDLGCDQLQGYYFAKPMSAEDLRAYAQARDIAAA